MSGSGLAFDLLLRLAALAAVVAVALVRPTLGDALFRRAEAAGERLARRRRAVPLVLATLTLALRAALLPVWPVPVPVEHDEFSYLLAADTFAAGRLANPPHALWPHFEAIHVLSVPTTAAKYPPAQGLFLALGQVLLGHPWFGVWLSAGLMIGAVTWMLQGFLPPGWALLGGTLCLVRLGLFSYWMNSYWGGAVAAAGGALVVGACPRILRRRRHVHLWTFAAGTAILANSRPFEGALIVAIAGTALLPGMWRRRFRGAALAHTLGAGGLLVVCLSWMAYYNLRITGDPLRLPYFEHARQYDVTSPWIFVPPRPLPAYRHAEIRNAHARTELNRWKDGTSARGTLRIRGIARATQVLLGTFLAAPLLLLLPRTARDRRVRLPLVCFAVLGVALLLETSHHTHYAAPGAACLYVLLVQALRHVRLWRPDGRPAGLFLSRALPVLSVASLVAAHAAPGPRPRADAAVAFIERRAEVERALVATAGKALVVVHYDVSHNSRVDWVYNRADLDRAAVVWARDMGEEENRRLVDSFADRHVWLLEPDRFPPRLVPYAVGRSSP